MNTAGVSGGFPPFKLSVRNEDRDTGQAIWVRGFVLEVYDYDIEVLRTYKNTVTVSASVTMFLTQLSYRGICLGGFSW